MSKNILKTIYPVILCLLLAVTIPALAEEGKTHDTIELANGEVITGTLLNDTVTVTTPYSMITLEKEKISGITINLELKDHDVISLRAGGLMEGNIDEPVFSFESVSGEKISIEKEKCKKITLKE